MQISPALQSCVTDYLSFTGMAHVNLYSDILHRFEARLRSVLAQVARRVQDCSVVYGSNVRTPFNAYASSVEQGIEYLLVIIDSNCEDVYHDRVPVGVHSALVFVPFFACCELSFFFQSYRHLLLLVIPLLVLGFAYSCN